MTVCSFSSPHFYCLSTPVHVSGLPEARPHEGWVSEVIGGLPQIAPKKLSVPELWQGRTWRCEDRCSSGAYCPRVSMVLGDVIDIGESVWQRVFLHEDRCGTDILFERVSKTTYPMQRHIPQRMMEQAMVQRNAKIIPEPVKVRAAALTITHPNAASIDIGSASHFVAVPPDRDDQPVYEFSSFTADLNALADWLTACKVDTVAMESTGVYWIPLFELLESRGFTVIQALHLLAGLVPGDQHHRRQGDERQDQALRQPSRPGLAPGSRRAAQQQIRSGRVLPTPVLTHGLAPCAVTAAAHKLARMIYTMLTKGEEYTDQGQDYYEERYRERVLRALSQRAAKLGMHMVPFEQPA